jgi:hypothetical protein
VNRGELAELAPKRMDSAIFRAALDRYGWRQVGGRTGLYERYVNEREPSLKLLIPLDPARPDYQQLLHEALYVLAGSRLAQAEQVVQHLVATPGDEVRFCKDVQTVAGAIPWKIGEELFQSASMALKASAKATIERRASFRNHNYRIANDFLGAALMGQTQVGSYVVTAYTPPEREFFEKESQRRDYLLFGTAANTGRQVVRLMRDVLGIAREALDECARTEQLEQFDEAVQYGFSKEMATALKGLVHRSDGASVAIDWSRTFIPRATDSRELPTFDAHRPNFASPAPTPNEVEFKPSDYPILEKVEERLGAPTTVRKVTVTGTVEVLTRQVGQLGVIVLDIRSGSTGSKIRVQLSATDYYRAMEAHREENVVRLSGREERLGNYFWLREPSRLEIVGPARRPQQRQLGDPGE